jgi:hypothetical protein
MTNDLIERLNMIVAELQGLPHVVQTCREAAAHIEALAERVRGDIALTVMLLDMDEEGDWPLEKAEEALAYIRAEHSGDCTKMPWTCMKCRADRAYEIAQKVVDYRARQARKDKENG